MKDLKKGDGVFFAVSDDPAENDAFVVDIRRRVYGFLIRKTKSHDTAEDLTQQTLLKLTENGIGSENFDTDHHRRAYATRTARRTLIDYSRKKQHPGSLDRALSLDDAPYFDPADETLLIEEQLVSQSRARGTLERLFGYAFGCEKRTPGTVRNLRALSLFEIQGLAYAEIAAAMRIPKGTVMSGLHRTRQSLDSACKRLELGKYR